MFQTKKEGGLGWEWASTNKCIYEWCEVKFNAKRAAGKLEPRADPDTGLTYDDNAEFRVDTEFGSEREINMDEMRLKSKDDINREKRHTYIRETFDSMMGEMGLGMAALMSKIKFENYPCPPEPTARNPPSISDSKAGVKAPAVYDMKLSADETVNEMIDAIEKDARNVPKPHSK